MHWMKKMKKIIETIDKIKGNKTIIFISHKKSSLKICNRIMQIHDGSLFEVKK